MCLNRTDLPVINHYCQPQIKVATVSFHQTVESYELLFRLALHSLCRTLYRTNWCFGSYQHQRQNNMFCIGEINPFLKAPTPQAWMRFRHLNRIGVLFFFHAIFIVLSYKKHSVQKCAKKYRLLFLWNKIWFENIKFLTSIFSTNSKVCRSSAVFVRNMLIVSWQTDLNKNARIRSNFNLNT